MAKVKTSDIRTRLSGLNESCIKPNNVNVNTVYQRVKTNYSYNNAKVVIENWSSLDKNSNVAFTKVMEVFDLVCENGTISEINTMTNYIIENVVPKVRDGAQTAELIKRKIGRFKTKVSTKINNKIDDIKNAATNATPNPAAPVPAQTSTVQPSGGSAANSEPEEKEVAAQESYLRIKESVNTYRQCDRVLTNHSKISKRFNIDKYIVERVNCEDDIKGCIYGICEFIETYNTPFGYKYNVALENINYALDKNGIKFDKKILVNACTDYFLMNQPITVKEGACLADMKYVLENNKFFDECDLEDVDYIIHPEEDCDCDEDKFIDNGDYYNVASYTESMDKAKKLVKKTKNEVKEIINKFKSEPEKKPEDVRSLISKIYTKSADEIISETPNLLELIRVFFLLTVVGINPILGCITMIVDLFIKMDLSRKETKKMIDNYKKELEKTEKEISKTDDPDKKKRLEEYKKTLNKGIEKLEEYYEDLHTSEEMEAKEAEKEEKENKKKESSKDDDFDFDDDDDWDLDSWDESSIELIQSIIILSEAVESLEESNFDTVLDRLEKQISELDNDSIDNLTDMCIYISGNSNRLANILRDAYTECKERESRDYIRYDCLSSNIYKLEHTESRPMDESTMVNDLYVLSEAMDYLNRDIITEANLANSLKLASERLKKTMVKLSDKEKTISKNIDSSIAVLRNNIEAALTNDSRENVIKGRILPSASKTIKTAIVAGTAWAINPAIAVIGMLGALATSKKLEAKQRQLILDDIETELVMVNKYIKIAEDKNDMKSLRQLLQTQKALERQKSRIKYKMKVVYNDKHAVTTKDRDNDDYDY